LKKLISILAAAIAVFTIAFTAPALAVDAAPDGAKIFSANCAACHAGGGNVIMANKTLKAADLKANGKDSVEAIVTQVTNGKGAMPAFGGRLSANQIKAVANYVLDQSTKW
jgi:cytochrome c6